MRVGPPCARRPPPVPPTSVPPRRYRNRPISVGHLRRAAAPLATCTFAGETAVMQLYTIYMANGYYNWTLYANTMLELLPVMANGCLLGYRTAQKLLDKKIPL